MTFPPADDDILFEVDTPLGFRVRTTRRYWTVITTIKHPIITGRETDVQAVLQDPEQVRVSKSDAQVLLFYRSNGEGRWLCAVAKQLNGEGFLITAYRTGNIKEGKVIWPR